jgi:nucleoside-diphosphate-sugar epimerase
VRTPRKVVVTGASGFVGTALTTSLAAQGHQVVALSRRAAPPSQSVKPVQFTDLGDADALRAAFECMEVVVHLAARVHVMREEVADPLIAFRRVNVEGTRAVYAVARQAGVRRFVFLSSVKAMGEGSAVPYRESDTPQPVDPYGVSKLEAEQVLAEGRAAGGPEFVVLRPPLVYGPGVRGNFRRLLRLAALSGYLPLPLGRIANQRSLVSLGNLVSTIEAAVEHPAAADKTFLVSDGEDISTSGLIVGLAAGMGRPAKLLPCPVSLVRKVAGAAGMSQEAERLFGSLVVDSSRVRDELGWAPPQSVAAGLAETAAWWNRRIGQATDV